MSTDITNEYIAFVIDHLEKGSHDMLKEQLDLLHPADIAEIIVHVPNEYAKDILSYFDNERNSDIVAELERNDRAHLLKALTPLQIAHQVIQNMESDDAVDLLSELEESVQEEVITSLENREQAEDIVSLLSYPEDSAGGLMAKEFVKVNINWTVHECIIELRKQAEEVENIHTVYAVDNSDKLLGIVSLKELILAEPQKKVETLFKDEIKTVGTLTSGVQVAQKMEKYDLVVLPVIDELGRLVGRITIDDVVDVIKEEAEKDYQMASGISEDVEMSDGVFALTKARFPWLLVGLVGGVAGAKVIGLFDIIETNKTLAYFIPLIAAMGGNVGVQSSAIVVQSIANNTLKGKVFPKLIKELGVGLLNGFLCATILFIFNYFFGDNIMISASVSISLFAVVIFAALFGTWIPLVLHHYKVDPALATGPFITTANDILGLFLYFYISELLL